MASNGNGNGNATEPQIKRLYAVLFSLGNDPEVWKQEHNIASFGKLTRQQCSDYITDLEKIETEKNGGATVKDDDPGIPTEGKGPGDVTYDEDGFVQEVTRMGNALQLAAREAVRVVKSEIEGSIENQGLGGVVKDFTICLFREYRSMEKEGRKRG